MFANWTITERKIIHARRFSRFGFRFQFEKLKNLENVSRVLNNAEVTGNAPSDKSWVFFLANLNKKSFLEEADLKTVNFLQSDLLENT